MTMENFRPYHVQDCEACLRLFDSNTPRFFGMAERPGFQQYLLDSPAYSVIERNGRIVACGGYAIEAEGDVASLCWGMVDQALHGQGLGRALTAARLAAIRAIPQIRAVRMSTSQHTQRFYAGFGFVPVKVTPDGHGPGIDSWDMVLRLDDRDGQARPRNA